uniref:Exportin-2 C-terminal domain-containing protein n=1 Tax=Romanomermis culicivorax TaxID=13658 RepID=A0A915K1B4_ROMCU
MLAEAAKKIAVVSKNPSKPHFNHYLFETLCLLIKICQRNVADSAQSRTSAFFEDTLFPPFEEILRNDVQEFMPYVFQVLALILGSKRTRSGLTDGYKALFPFLLAPELWTKSGNIPGLVALIQAYIKVGPDFVVEQHLMPVLGAFQSLLASKANDPHVFSILNSLIEHNAIESLPKPTLLKILNLIFTRISRTRTTKFVKNFVYFVSLFVLRYGPINLIHLIEEIQNGLFTMFVDKIYLPDVTKVDGKIEKNVCNVALIRFLTDAPDIMLNDKNSELWAKLLTALVQLSQNIAENSGGDDDEVDLDVLNGGGESAVGDYAAAYSQLIYACCADSDPTSGFSTNGQTLVAYFGQCLQKLAQTPPYGECLSAAVKLLDESTRNYVQQRIFVSIGINGS